MIAPIKNGNNMIRASKTHQEPASDNGSDLERSNSHQRKRAASAALGALVLTSGIAATADAATNYGSNLSAGRLTIALADYDRYKADSCTNDNLNGSTSFEDTDDDNYLNVFAANSNNYDDGLANPFIGNNTPVIVETVDLWDLIDMLNDLSSRPIELTRMDSDNNDQN
ncbi:hypothetical protein LAUMK41_05381 [Mycobacterium attenuatum]|nr:hypothetical protein LAUMK41_05381 [Mycobacterium attenuatum]